MENSFNNDELLISQAKKPLGAVLIEAGLISASQLEIALQQQASTNLRIGEILASHNWIKQQTADFFVDKWSTLLSQQQKKPLVYYFRHSGLLDENQIASILREQ
ncbi:MAG: pentapeptide repeat-containing protein, partial [Waterburya sp.]